MPYNDMIRWETTQIIVNQEVIVNIKFQILASLKVDSFGEMFHLQQAENKLTNNLIENLFMTHLRKCIKTIQYC